MGDVLAQGRAAVADQPYFEGRKNAYECDGDGAMNASRGLTGCGSFIVTIDVAAGVTPFMLKCGNCGAYAHSKFYRVSDWLDPTHEWYRPDSLDGVDPAYFDHLSHGGLILRPIEGRADEWLKPPSQQEKDMADVRLQQLAKLVASERAQARCGEELRKQKIADPAPPFVNRQQRRAAERRARK